MNRVLGWIDNFFAKAYSEEWSIISAPLHWAIRGITSLIFQQFQNTSSAWNVYYSDTHYYVTQINKFIDSSRNAHGYTLRVRIPSVVSWASSSFARLLSAILGLGKELAKDFASLTAFIMAKTDALEKWVLAHVWAPLWAYAQQTYKDLLKWGYTAWWAVTHLPELAESMIFFIAASMEKHAWDLAGILGKFALSLVLRNAKRLALLTEDIVTAVL